MAGQMVFSFTPKCCDFGVLSNAVMELARGIRSQLEGLVSGLAGTDLTPMSLGLSHSLSRYKLKFSPDKVGTCCQTNCNYQLATAVNQVIVVVST
jgi:hypothetical protein